MRQKIINRIVDAGLDPHNASDEELLGVKGVGKKRLQEVRELRAVATKYFQIVDDNGAVFNVLHGTEIPPEYDPAKYVKRGQAEWR